MSAEPSGNERDLSGPPRKSTRPTASTHWMRHTFGSRIAALTRDVVLARNLLRHAPIATTSVYLDEMARGDAVEKMLSASTAVRGSGRSTPTCRARA
jgi:hypothetical protein